MLNCIYTENNCRFPIVITTVINATVTLKETVAGDCGAITVIATTYLHLVAFEMVTLKRGTRSVSTHSQLVSSERLWCVKTAIKQHSDGVSLLPG